MSIVLSHLFCNFNVLQKTSDHWCASAVLLFKHSFSCNCSWNCTSACFCK